MVQSIGILEENPIWGPTSWKLPFFCLSLRSFPLFLMYCIHMLHQRVSYFFSFCLVFALKLFVQHQMIGHMHETLNIN